MIEASWFVFIVASLVLIATPGQDMILVMSRSVAQGAAAGIVTAGGVSVGLVGHTVLATLGLGAILRASEWLFIALKLVGAAYLIYLGVRALWESRTSRMQHNADAPRSQKAGTWKTGFTTNLLNPKIAVFYTGLLPQLVPAGWPTGPSLALLVLIHAAITIVWLSGYVVLLSRARSTFEKPRVRQALERITGTVLLGFGAKIALEAR